MDLRRRSSKAGSRNSTVFAGYCLIVLLCVILLLACFGATSVSADEEEPNVAVRVLSLKAPNLVGINSTFPVSLDVEYSLHGRPNNATIRAAIYEGTINYRDPLWESQPTMVSGGGDKIWNANLTASPTEGYMKLTAYAYYLENASWYFYNNTVNGPGFSQVTVKVAKTAILDIQLGTPGIAVMIDNSEIETSPYGDGHMAVAVGTMHNISVPVALEFQNSTRIVFTGWDDGITQTQRSVAVNGDLRLTGFYKTQYLLRVRSIRSQDSAWYDRGSKVELQEPILFPMNGLLGLLGARYDFVEWTGDLNSTSPQATVTVDGPKDLYAEYSADYSQLAVTGVAVAAVAAVILLLARRKGKTPDKAGSASMALRCNSCGMEMETGWSCCSNCGAEITPSKPPKDV
jgi:hypothetical protein